MRSRATRLDGGLHHASDHHAERGPPLSCTSGDTQDSSLCIPASFRIQIGYSFSSFQRSQIGCVPTINLFDLFQPTEHDGPIPDTQRLTTGRSNPSRRYIIFFHSRYLSNADLRHPGHTYIRLTSFDLTRQHDQVPAHSFVPNR